MFKFGFSNIRRLRSIEPIEIKPVTLLVGRNSSGKSTYLRTFPLLRQSIVTRTSSPILWYGDLVDFGSYETTVSDGDMSKGIEFKFLADKITPAPTLFYGADEDVDETELYSEVSYTATIVPIGTRTRISKIRLTFGSPVLEYNISLSEDDKISGLSVNNQDATSLLGGSVLNISSGSLFPELHASRISARGTSAKYFYLHRMDRIIEPIRKFITPLMHGRTSDDKIETVARNLVNIGPMDDAVLLRSAGALGPSSWKSYVRRIFGASGDQAKRAEFRNVLALCVLPELLNRATDTFRNLMSETLYIGPARAASERYYRYQDLAVSEIDPDGKNFPMFLNSLSRSHVERLSHWVSTLFGYGLAVDQVGGHISINLIENGVSANIVDTGYGMSQILPVLAQIWWTREIRSSIGPRNTRSLPSPIILAIEQPELHLHPAHQALLADAIVGEASPKPRSATDEQARPVHFVIETHSETLINRLGELVAENRISVGDIQIVLFEPDETGERTTAARVVNFATDGSLLDWPYGFFQPAAKA